MQINLRSIMIAVALSAVGFTCLGVVGGTEALLFVVLLSLPFSLRPAGRRQAAIALACSLVPALALASLYATWITAWVVIGHEPKAVDESPARLGPIVAGPYVVTTLLFAAMLPSLVGSLCLTTIELKLRKIEDPAHEPWKSPLLLGPLAWVAFSLAIRYEPYLLLKWFRS